MAEADKPLILNVNDHDQTRYLVRKILEPRGFRVIEAKTGEEALHALDQHPLLVVLDVKLPDLSGFEVCRMIKASPKTSSILVLLTSATYVTTDRRVQGLDVGADGYLAAPYEPTELVATVKSLLRLGAAERNLREHANQLRENDRRKDEFLAMLAHELRNPLAAINSALPLLDSYRQADERFERVRSMVGRQVTHLAKMVDELLDVSRITQGRIELTRAPVSLAEVIEHALSAARPLFEQRRQRVEVKLEDPRFTVDGDATRLEQVIGNLLDNASKYTEPSGRIELDVRQGFTGRYTRGRDDGQRRGDGDHRRRARPRLRAVRAGRAEPRPHPRRHGRRPHPGEAARRAARGQGRGAQRGRRQGSGDRGPAAALREPRGHPGRGRVPRTARRARARRSSSSRTTRTPGRRSPSCSS